MQYRESVIRNDDPSFVENFPTFTSESFDTMVNLVAGRMAYWRNFHGASFAPIPNVEGLLLISGFAPLANYKGSPAEVYVEVTI